MSSFSSWAELALWFSVRAMNFAGTPVGLPTVSFDPRDLYLGKSRRKAGVVRQAEHEGKNAQDCQVFLPRPLGPHSMSSRKTCKVWMFVHVSDNQRPFGPPIHAKKKNQGPFGPPIHAKKIHNIQFHFVSLHFLAYRYL